MSYLVDTPSGKIVEAILRELPGIIAVAVVDLDSGMSMASSSNNPTFDADAAAAYHTEVLKQQLQAMHAMRMADDRSEGLSVTLADQLHLLQLAPDGTQFLYMAVNPREINLAIARSTAKRYAQQLR
jgi:predicted regulator of Ras-like GTPase activity (Roadblock/LC7/MglB family)